MREIITKTVRFRMHRSFNILILFINLMAIIVSVLMVNIRCIMIDSRFFFIHISRPVDDTVTSLSG